MEVAQRLGETCTLFGIDPWESAIERARKKIIVKNINNTNIIKGFCENIPFNNEFFDMIISNNGISVVKDKTKALEECFRVCKTNGRLIFTIIFPQMMNEFYLLLKESMKECGINNYNDIVDEHIHTKRKDISFYKTELSHIGFNIINLEANSFYIRFLDADTLFNYFFFRLCFMEGWLEIINKFDKTEILIKLKQKLNLIALQKGEIKLNIPFACIHCEKG